MAETKKIAVVVVTYNRLELLKECIIALKNQTRKSDEIVIVNNDSTDGTKEWLNKQKDLSVIHQANLGGAGGFHAGIKTAYKKGYDWIWCMDDDCLPELNSLEKLIKNNSEDCVVLNSLVVTKTQREKLNFGLEGYKLNEYYDFVKQVENRECISGANFFNGTLLSKCVISKVGFPNPFFFIYGDEYEYYLRIKNSNIQIKTITSSLVMHPEQKHKYIGKGKWFYRYNYFTSLRAKYYSRNRVLLFIKYNEIKFKRLVKIFLLDIYGLLFIQRKFGLILVYLGGVFNGIIMNIFSAKYD